MASLMAPPTRLLSRSIHPRATDKWPRFGEVLPICLKSSDSPGFQRLSTWLSGSRKLAGRPACSTAKFCPHRPDRSRDLKRTYLREIHAASEKSEPLENLRNASPGLATCERTCYSSRSICFPEADAFERKPFACKLDRTNPAGSGMIPEKHSHKTRGRLLTRSSAGLFAQTHITDTAWISQERRIHGSTQSLSKSKSWCSGDILCDPVQMLQECVQEPLLSKEERVFQATEDEIRTAQDLFRSTATSRLVTFKGVVDPENLPVYNVPEVAFAGMSNVGKSSLIKALFFDPSEVRISVSKKPGHTTVLKCYKVGKHFSLVDMPGYGRNMPGYFVQSVEGFLQTRKRLLRTFLLIDGATGLSHMDQVGIEMMEEFGKPYAIVMTKIDSASQHQVLRNYCALKKEQASWMSSCLPQIFLVSAHADAGLAFLRTFIAYVTGNITIQGL